MLRMNSASPQSLTRMGCDYKRQKISDNDKRKTHPRMISIASTPIHPGRVSLASTSLLTSLISSVGKTSVSVANPAENCLSKRKTTRVPQSVRETGASGKRFEMQRGEAAL